MPPDSSIGQSVRACRTSLQRFRRRKLRFRKRNSRYTEVKNALALAVPNFRPHTSFLAADLAPALTRFFRSHAALHPRLKESQYPTDRRLTPIGGARDDAKHSSLPFRPPIRQGAVRGPRPTISRPRNHSLPGHPHDKNAEPPNQVIRRGCSPAHPTGQTVRNTPGHPANLGRNFKRPPPHTILDPYHRVAGSPHAAPARCGFLPRVQA